MASVKYGAMITELKGKVGGQAFQGGNVGYVLRNIHYTSRSAFPRRQRVNYWLAQLAYTWRSLTSGNKAAWTAIAAAWTFTDRYGNTYEGSAFQIYMSYNGLRLSLGLAAVTTPSALVTPTNPGVISVAISLPSDYDLIWSNTGSTNDYVVLFASAPGSPGSTLTGAKMVQLGSWSINGLLFIDFQSEYEAEFGIPQVGAAVRLMGYFRDGRYPRNAYAFDYVVIVT